MPSPRALVLFALLTAMEVLAGFAVVVGSSLLDLGGLEYSAFWLVLLGGLLGSAAGVVLGAAHLSERWGRVALLAAGAAVAGGLGVAVAGSPVTFLVTAFLGGLFFWRGLAVAEDVPDAEDVQLRFGLGYVVLFVGVVWVVGRGIIYQRPIWLMLAVTGIAYTVLGMAALVTARLERSREPGAAGAVIVAVGLQIVLVVAAAVIALQIFSLDLAGAVWGITHPFWDALGATLFRLVSLVAGPIDRFISLVRPHGTPVHPAAPALPGQEQQPKKHLQAHHASNLPLTIAAIVFAALILLGVAILIWRAVPRLPRWRRETGFSEERRSLWSWGAFVRALLGWFRSLAKESARAAEETITRTRRRVFGVYPDDPVRRVYARLLRRAAGMGLPRSPDVTPNEFLLLLCRRWPEGAPAFTALTDAYVVRRYGNALPVIGQETELEHHWQRARAIIRPLPPPEGEQGETRKSPAAQGRRDHHGAAGARPRSPWRTQLENLRAGMRWGDAPAVLTRDALVMLASFALPAVMLVVFLALLTFLTGH